MNTKNAAISLNDVILTEHFPMQGANLIEASAGTGKTYCIETLYLRMVIVDGLPVQKILVVTFTEAATHELRDRLRKILEKAGRDLAAVEDGAGISDERIAALAALALSLSGDDEQGESPVCVRQRRIANALRDFDMASIHTIHGFCNTVLKRYAFECGQPFGAELQGKDDSLLEDVCADWWRRYGYPPDSRIAALADFGTLLKLVKDVFSQPAARILPAVTCDSFARAASQLDDVLSRLKEAIDTDVLEQLISRASWRSPGREADVQRLNAFRQPDDPADASLFAVIGKLQEKIDKLIASEKDTAFDPQTVWKPYAEAMAAHGQLLPRAVLDVVQECCARKREQNTITYDDLIQNLHRAVLSPDYGEALCEVLQQEYAAALIDEFQDTDPFQYEIFYKVFIEGGTHPVFLVGDPKQAIYAFRSGDIFTYFAARDREPRPRRYTLDKNYRSVAGMIDAVNTVFKDGFDSAHFTETIPYDGTLKAKGKGDALTDASDPSPAPFRILYYDACETGRSKTTVTKPSYQMILRQMAQEAHRLLHDPGVRIGERRVQPGDIAVLVGSHKEAQFVYRHLQALGIPAIRQSAGNVFASDQAKDFLVLLKAIADPQKAPAIYSTLATDLFPVDDAMLYRFAAEGVAGGVAQCRRDGDNGAQPTMMTWDDVLTEFREARQSWIRGCLIEAVNRIFGRFGVRAHVLQQDGGERNLTNLMQLVELAHGVGLERHLGPDGVVDWLLRQLERDTREENDAFELRLESDARAVSIMTVFKSKGLEFPIVFMPTLGLRQPTLDRRNTYRFHEKTDGEWALCVDLGKDKDNGTRDKIEQELENRRLFYVAATRAVYRSYLVWGNFCEPEKDNSPLSMVFRKDRNVTAENLPPYAADNLRCAQLFASESIAVEDKGIPVPFDARQLLAVPEVPGSPALPGSSVGAVESPLACWTPADGSAVSVNKDRGHASYSGIAPVHAGDGILRDVDEADVDVPRPMGAAAGIFSFPGGKRIGTCWHALFEQIEFTDWAGDADAAASARRRVAMQTIDDILTQFNICPGRNEEEVRQQHGIIQTMVQHVLAAELTADTGAAFRLSEIGKRDKCAELDFDFPLRRWDHAERRTTLILQVIERYWKDDPLKAGFVHSLRTWNRKIPQGYMTGFIDLLFRHEGRYYILDWKSNRRDGRPEDFDPTGLADEMAAHAYYLQYLIYLVATHQYLRGCLPDYSYDKHIGGVFYLFLRGVNPSAPGRGIFYDRPPVAMIEELSAVLGDFDR